ncbi:hypothetical protein E2C01_048042 [Portunus trituberculatus]|uniref:Uncharacterized protein n=1 Tax=Portunus trituberculatus TaxID=210409 RepID=A0A5B7G9N1_PORTR|nr:hypothetical protein [Portunus trituberculatus]
MGVKGERGHRSRSTTTGHSLSRCAAAPPLSHSPTKTGSRTEAGSNKGGGSRGLHSAANTGTVGVEATVGQRCQVSALCGPASELSAQTHNERGGDPHAPTRYT